MPKRFLTPVILFGICILFIAGSRAGLFDNPALSSSDPQKTEKDQRIAHLEEELANQKLLNEVIEKVLAFHLDGAKTERKDLISAAVHAIAQSMDPHSTYFSPEEFKAFTEPLQGHFAGIGAYVSELGGAFTISSPIYSGPAYAAGLLSGDIITAADGVSLLGKPLHDSIKLIRGKPGTEVKLMVLRRGWTKPRPIAVTRAVVKVSSVRSEMLPEKVGLIHIYTFGADTAKDFTTALAALKAQGAKGLLLDLRGNGGGYFGAAREILDQLLPKKKLIVYSKGRENGPEKRVDYLTQKPAAFGGLPILVLVNGRSASASEIVSGSLQDHKRATILGETTFGKGSIQRMIELDSKEGAVLKLTMAQYYLPSGRSIHGIGVKPDLVVPTERVEMWELREVVRLRDAGAFETYMAAHFKKDHKQMLALAESDGKDASRYPGFEAWYTSLKTKASKETIRRRLRRALLTKVSDERKREIFFDLQEDLQMQHGVLQLLKTLKIDPKTVAAYKSLATLPAPKPTEEAGPAPAHRR